jgi:LacI family transcriptional regulator
VAKNTTMTDVAMAAGVSQTTVSMVLNDVPYARVAKATREKVLKAAEELGYNRGLRSSNNGLDGTRVIGLLIDEVGTTPFFSTLLEGAELEASAAGCIISTFRTRSDAALEIAAIEALRRQGNLAGVLYATLIKQVVDFPEALADIPTVMLNCHSHNRSDLSVVSADQAAAHAATEMLLAAGHRRIAHLAGDSWMVAGREREAGYRQALLNRDIPVDKSLIFHGAWTIYGGRDLTYKLLDMPERPTAIFCFNDRMAVGAYEAIKERGLRIPDDISVVGFDNEQDFASYAHPPLTTMVLPHVDMGREAVRILLDYENIRGMQQHPRMLKIECPLVLRGSVAKPPRTTRKPKVSVTS